jgi:RHS repeat-associated protein
MVYDLMGSTLRKSQAITLGTDSVSPHSMDVSYSYTHTKPNAASWIGNLNLLYDKNGNLESRTDTATNDYRRFLWNEDNQLLGVEENGYISRYTYDAQGERIVKAHGGMQGVFINGAPAASIIRAENITVYVSPFITVNGNRFTKHYYAGTKRIASKIGNGQFNNKYTPENRIILAGNVNAIDRYNQIEGSRAEYIRQLGVPPGPPTMKGIYGEPEFTGSLIPDGGTPTNAAPANWPRKPIQAPPGGPPGAPVQFGPDITNETVAGGFGFVTTGHVEETDQYFYHSDHLGSSAYITDRQGKVSQFVVYLPFGEALIDSHANPDVMPYKFNGKEKDEETGLYYYGARYYNGDDQVWMGVDPLWEKYPGVSPYVYCLNNPVKLVDPDGRNPGDFFRTVTAAVKDFGNYYNGASIIRGTEFGSTIYSIKSNGKSGYTYTEADIGENDNVRPSAPLEGKTSVAWAHTHGKYEEGYLNNDFSSSDKWYSYNHGIDGYVVTPDGSLKKYDVETTNVSTVSTDMPSDPNDPGRKNENKPVDVPMKKEREQTTMEQNKKPELKIPETQKTNIEWAF